MRSSLSSADGITWSLRSMTRADRERLYLWRNDPEIRPRMTGDAFITPEEHLAWCDRIEASERDVVTIFEVNAEPAGVMSLTRLDPVHHNARWGFYLRPRAPLPAGSGSRMAFLLLRHAFEELGLHRVYADVVGSNERSIGMHRKLGFAQEGIQREHLWRGETWNDVVLFGMLREEFVAVRSELERRLFG